MQVCLVKSEDDDGVNNCGYNVERVIKCDFI